MSAGVPLDFGLEVLIFLIAALYSSVGHGGASGYLAILSLYGLPPATISSNALALNILVASLSSCSFIRAGHFSWSIAWPFIAGSVPAALLGGTFKLTGNSYYLVLALTLGVIAFRLLFTLGFGSSPSGPQQIQLSGTASPRRYGVVTGIGTGAIIGLLSGMVGIGGGVFLTPLIVLMNWSPTKVAAAVSAVFIVVNSIAALTGRLASGQIDCSMSFPLMMAALLGGLAGSHCGANRLPESALKLLLAVVLLVATGKLLMLSGVVRGH